MTARQQQIEALRHAIAVYRRAITEGRHGQCRDWHLRVANDAEHTLAKHTGAPAPKQGPTYHQKLSLTDALREVYRELAFVAHEIGFSPLRDRQRAAELLGVTSEQYRRVTS
ncbi:MAG: hypothetical protein ROZ37_01255 [Aromatoleum sp.]|jgi:type II secretory pathway pseudopilin PulG|uniref:hypothetical protein n=1 Tax=Aromatoleum sp. TaxID=2307007 RepID=UPI00289573FD|nr:hypothetical protein [Aromatoleum sp.]MDT3668943.1 hypothetical protein [Aromatoleum sp.]